MPDKYHKGPILPTYTIAGLTRTGGRKANEDSIFVMETDILMMCSINPAYWFRGVLALVADGMGGGDYGEIASSLAIRVFVKEFLGHVIDSNTSTSYDEIRATANEAMKIAFQKANEAVFEEAKRCGTSGNMATTLVVVFSIGNWGIVGNVGDSRCYLLESSGPPSRPVTLDHSKVMAMVRAGEITYEQARTHPQKNVITQAIGINRVVSPDIKTLTHGEQHTRIEKTRRKRTAPPTYLLLCSDGLSDVVYEKAVWDVVFTKARHSNLTERRKNLEDYCLKLYKMAMKNRTTDNVSIVLVDITDALSDPDVDGTTLRGHS
jgi:protein phosphatase